MIHNQSIDFIISTLLTSIIVNKFKLDMMYYGIIFGLSTYLISQFSTFTNGINILQNIGQYYGYFVYGITILMISAAGYYLYSHIANKKLFDIVIKNDNTTRIYTNIWIYSRILLLINLV